MLRSSVEPSACLDRISMRAARYSMTGPLAAVSRSRQTDAAASVPPRKASARAGAFRRSRPSTRTPFGPRRPRVQFVPHCAPSAAASHSGLPWVEGVGAVARIGGRNSWLAWPAALLCAAVVAALAWLAQPMLPVAVTWVGDTLRAATTPVAPAPEAASVAETALAPGDIDCRALYPDRLWAELTWTPSVLLSQGYAAPATAVTALTDALAPSVRITCHWRADGGRTIVSTLAGVAADAGPVADASLRGQGFACTQDADALVCERTAGDVREEHVVRGGLWLSSVETAWHPEGYGDRLATHVWG
jgi:hypothetical protein